MGVTTFDTLKFVRRLEKVGVPSAQAEAQAEVLTEAFKVNLEELVTKEYLTAEFATQNERFAKERAHTDKQFAEVRANFQVLYWMISVVAAGVLLPIFERYLS